MSPAPETLTGLSDPRPAGTQPAGQPGPVAQGATDPALAARLAAAAPVLAQGAVEITLSPEELGRVRMTLSAGEGGMVVSVLAERAETLELMRRNIDQLARDLQAMGYAGLSFAFGRDDRPDRAAPAHGAPPDELPPPAADSPPRSLPARAPGAGGIDLRV